MTDKFLNGPARLDRLFQSVQDNLRVLCRRCIPAQDLVRKVINKEAHIDKATPSGHKREVGYLGGPEFCHT